MSWGGYKVTVPLDTLKSLLITHSNKITPVELSQQKWIRDDEKGIIKIQDPIYILMATDNKRKFIIEDGLLIGIRP